MGGLMSISFTAPTRELSSKSFLKSFMNGDFIHLILLTSGRKASYDNFLQKHVFTLPII